MPNPKNMCCLLLHTTTTPLPPLQLHVARLNEKYQQHLDRISSPLLLLNSLSLLNLPHSALSRQHIPTPLYAQHAQRQIKSSLLNLSS